MEKKSMIFHIFLTYVVWQILCNVYFLLFGNTLHAKYTFWLFTIIGSIFWGVKFCNCKVSQIFSFQKNKLTLIRMLFCFEIMSIFVLMCVWVAPESTANPIWDGTFAFLHLPEYILSQFVEQIIYVLENTLHFHISMNILNHFYSIYAFTAVILFMELYLLSKEKASVQTHLSNQ